MEDELADLFGFFLRFAIAFGVMSVARMAAESSVLSGLKIALGVGAVCGFLSAGAAAVGPADYDDYPAMMMMEEEDGSSAMRPLTQADRQREAVIGGGKVFLMLSVPAVLGVMYDHRRG